MNVFHQQSLPPLSRKGVLVLPLQDDDFALENGRLELLEKMPGQRMVGKKWGIYHSPVQLQVQ